MVDEKTKTKNSNPSPGMILKIKFAQKGKIKSEIISEVPSVGDSGTWNATKSKRAKQKQQ